MIDNLQPTDKNIQNKIYTIRGVQVMLDRNLAELYDDQIFDAYKFATDLVKSVKSSITI